VVDLHRDEPADLLTVAGVDLPPDASADPLSGATVDLHTVEPADLPPDGQADPDPIRACRAPGPQDVPQPDVPETHGAPAALPNPASESDQPNPASEADPPRACDKRADRP
jgi:hypothetical protein